jgi:hypothetical protein
MADLPIVCIYFERSDPFNPLLQFKYHGRKYWIYSQHLPIMIHKPAQLANELPGLMLLRSSDSHP